MKWWQTIALILGLAMVWVVIENGIKYALRPEGGRPTPPSLPAIKPELVGIWVKESRSPVTADGVTGFNSYHCLHIAADGRYREWSETGHSFHPDTDGDQSIRRGRVTVTEDRIEFDSTEGRRYLMEYQLVDPRRLRLNDEQDLHVRLRAR